MSMGQNLPEVVGNRNHFVAIEDYVEMVIRTSDFGFSESDRPRIRGLFTRLVHDISDAMVTGAERGISQATNLILDSKFYEAKRGRRERSRKAEAEKRAAQEADKQRRISNPTIAEINESMRHINSNIAYHEKSLESCRGQIRYLQSRPAFLMSDGKDCANA